MSNYKKIASITVSPTLADPDGTKHNLHKKKEALVEPCSWNDLRDKPFGEFVENIQILPEQILQFTTINGATNASIGDNKLSNCEIGDTIKLVIDGGTVYGIVKHSFNPSGRPYCVGNAALFRSSNEDTGEMFYYDESFGGLYIDSSIGAGEHTVAMYKTVTTINTLDPKFLGSKPLQLAYDEYEGCVDNVLRLVDEYGLKEITADDFYEMTKDRTDFPMDYISVYRLDGSHGRARGLYISSLSDNLSVRYVYVDAFVDGQIERFYIGANPNAGES